MIRPLRRRLARIFRLLTGLMLAVLLLFSAVPTLARYRSDSLLLHQQTYQRVIRELRQKDSLSDSVLSELIRDSSYNFYIEVAGIPLHLSQINWRSEERQALLAALKEKVSSPEDPVTFTLELDGNSYRATAAAEGEYTIWFTENLSGETARERKLIAGCLLLFAAGFAILWILSGLLARAAARPTEVAFREQENFVAAAEHELRSPLAVIRASLYAAGREDLPAAAREKILLADREAERLGRLTEELLTLTGRGNRTLPLAPVSPDSVCLKLCERFSSLTDGAHPFRLDLPEEPLPEVPSDEESLIRILTVFLENAAEHTPPDTPVTLSARKEASFISFSVSDQGPGVPDSAKDVVFRRFSRGDKSRTDKNHFGLGLSIARELAGRLGGQITLTDTPGGGATFTVRIPV